MKLVKSLLLGSAASLAAVAGAQAADLPMTKAAPVDYVRVCSVHGAGFFYIPGSDTCIYIGGRVRAEYMYLEPKWDTPGNGRYRDATGFRARGRLNVDTRTSTEFGTVRAFFRFDITRDTGAYNNGFASGSVVKTNLDKAFIQFAGITAGVAQSMFDFWAEAWNYGTAPGVLPGSDAGSTQMLAYSATFGNGFSATIALEDRNQRNLGNSSFYYDVAGERLPDVVANVRVDQDWGSAQLSGAVHQLNSGALDPFGGRVDNEYGWAIQGGVKVNLPMLAAGDQLWLEAAYADGALNYLGVTGDVGIGPVGLISADAVLLDNGSIKKTKGWNVLGAFQHYWTPSLRSVLWGSYTSVDYSGSAISQYTLLRDFDVLQVAGQLVWSPTKAFDIGVEVLYSNIDARHNYAAPVVLKSSEDQWQTRLRFQRDF
jgi:hypothetical protein